MTELGSDPRYQPTLESPLRMLALGAAEPAWYQADHADRTERIVPALIRCFSIWEEWGATCLATFDDDLLMVGTPRTRGQSFYLLYEVPGLEMASAMINLFRVPLDGVRLDTYFRFEAMLGRSFFPVENPERR